MKKLTKNIPHLMLAGVCLLCLSGPVMAQDLNAALVNDAGKAVGSALVRQVDDDDGILLTLEVNDLSPGWHGLHIHAVGNCDDHADHFKMAGGHLADADEKHGFLNAEGPHKGDLPNIWVHKDGTAKVEIYSEDLDVKDLIDKDGSAIMIHEKPDDHKTDPAGDSGTRLACGVLTR